MSMRKSRTLLLMSAFAAVYFGSVQPASADLKGTLSDLVGNVLNGGASTNDPYNSYNQYGYQNQYPSQYANPYNPYADTGVSAAPLLPGNGGNLSQILGAAAAAAGMRSSGLPGAGFLGGGGGQSGPIVHNGVLLNPRFYNGPYRGSDHQMQSALNLDWTMTLTGEQIQNGMAGGNLSRRQGNGWISELNAIADDKIHACGRKGLSYNDAYDLVARLNNLISRIKMAWHSPNYSVSGRVLTPMRNETLEKLYLLTTPPRFH